MIEFLPQELNFFPLQKTKKRYRKIINIRHAHTRVKPKHGLQVELDSLGTLSSFRVRSDTHL